MVSHELHSKFNLREKYILVNYFNEAESSWRRFNSNSPFRSFLIRIGLDNAYNKSSRFILD